MKKAWGRRRGLSMIHWWNISYGGGGGTSGKGGGGRGPVGGCGALPQAPARSQDSAAAPQASLQPLPQLGADPPPLRVGMDVDVAHILVGMEHLGFMAESRRPDESGRGVGPPQGALAVGAPVGQG